ncbi:related to ARO80-positive transcription regulator of ARO9 and ARO10 [Rhynchosporium agropyri]|uniref:Related to ARO80-positive transcription regulator of ARO9 and ARO10 n=1 Tax=Rhynchosporium agropyri TaxID=914238 RepID=A0A1E1L0Q9_9HELO|nr:related to ARO80-positive transcription regulator of ARO9 and ARO10 [Rhynchosporium agropyri]
MVGSAAGDTKYANAASPHQNGQAVEEEGRDVKIRWKLGDASCNIASPDLLCVRQKILSVALPRSSYEAHCDHIGPLISLSLPQRSSIPRARRRADSKRSLPDQTSIQMMASIYPEESVGSRSPQQTQQQQPQHKRVYQACIPCRRRKVKCDLGSVDSPGDPPCVRCRRESKECFFSATRRKRKHEDGGPDSLDGYEYQDEYIVRNGRKMIQGSPPAPVRQSSLGAPASSRTAVTYADNSPVIVGPPLTPGGSIGRTQPLRRPTEPSRDNSHREERTSPESNTQLENLEAQEVMRREVYGPHDALDLLYKAATDSPDHHRRTKSQVSSMLNNSTVGHGHKPLASPLQSVNRPYQADMRPPEVRRDIIIDPALSSKAIHMPERTQDQGYKDAVKAWSRFRFVRAGWFTPSEAIDYIKYYYEYLSPLTPISPPTFRDPGTHLTLLMEEPILTVALLTIATRYKQISGPGGHCRSHAIHEQLWTYLRGMIERCLWGQEAFGGGFCGSGAESEAQTSSTAPWRGLRKGSLRTLGTIESLMILTEWHPRALHFPPAEATDELMLPSYDAPDNYSTDEDGHARLPRGVGGKRIESWLEPAWRSDRMCWMLLSTAMGLSYELGVFDEIEQLLAAGGEMTRPEYEDEAYRLRAARIKRLLLIYVTQLAGRLGWTNMVPENLRVTDPAFAPRKRRGSVDGKTPDTITSVNTFNYIPNLELDDQIIHCWAGISNAMRIGNEKLFRSRQYTTRIIKDGSYVELLKDFQPMLRAWKTEFERFKLPQYISHILSIEYQYVRIYVNSLSLQAVVERCSEEAGHRFNATGHPGGGSVLGAMSTENQQTYYGKLPLATFGSYTATDQDYIKEVVDGSRELLRIVVDRLLPNDYLKHAPVRTYFRIISGAMFLLKTFALGATRVDVEISIGLMDRAVDALRTCVVDDVHLGIRFADLLETLTSRLRSRFISAPGPNPNGDSISRIRSPAVHQEHDHNKRQRIDPREQIREWNAATPNYGMGSADLNVSATPFDLQQGSFIPAAPGTPYVPGPGSSYGGGDMQDTFGGFDANGQSDFWYLPPGTAFYQHLGDQGVTQTAEGVNVGGIDLLDFMAWDTPTFVDENESGGGY